MAEIKDARKLFVHQLGEALNMERTVLTMLKTNEKEATDPEVKQLFGHHREETEGQIRNLEQAFSSLGEEAAGHTCHAMEGMKKEAEDVIEKVAPELLDGALAGGATHVEHYEIATYNGLDHACRDDGPAGHRRSPAGEPRAGAEHAAEGGSGLAAARAARRQNGSRLRLLRLPGPRLVGGGAPLGHRGPSVRRQCRFKQPGRSRSSPTDLGEPCWGRGRESNVWQAEPVADSGRSATGTGTASCSTPGSGHVISPSSGRSTIGTSTRHGGSQF